MTASNRTEPPTPRRLREARRKGQVAVSRDLVAAVSLAGGLLALAFTVHSAWAQLVEAARRWTGMALATTSFSASAAAGELAAATYLAARFVLPVAASAAVSAVAAGVLQTGGLVSAAALTPKTERLSPAAGFKRLLGMRGLTESAKVWVRLAAAAIAVASVASFAIGALSRMAVSTGSAPLSVAGSIVWQMSVRALAAAIAIGAADVVLQRRLHAHDLRMSKDEVKRDHKEDEGDPLIKHARRQAHREIALQRMIAAAGSASFVAVNPTHLAVAVRYEPDKDEAPRVVAKGAGAIARRIRREAERYGSRIVYDKPLARSLYRVGLDEEIPEALFAVVAEVLAVISRDADR